jgi:hypothetical protein
VNSTESHRIDARACPKINQCRGALTTIRVAHGAGVESGPGYQKFPCSTAAQGKRTSSSNSNDYNCGMFTVPYLPVHPGLKLQLKMQMRQMSHNADFLPKNPDVTEPSLSDCGAKELI